MASDKGSKGHLSTGLVYSQKMLRHETGGAHPEQPARIKSCYNFLDQEGILAHLKLISPYKAADDEICLAHQPSYVEKVKQMAQEGGGYLDLDTPVCPASYDAACLSAGGVLKGIDSLFKSKIKNCFCLIRPPGHHATSDRGMGFCLFDNLAIGARYAKEAYQVSRVLILDWDAHHGNGIQDIFYDDSSVLYISLHQYPHYPGTGSFDQIGNLEGKGFSINFPFPPGAGDQVYLDAFKEVIWPVASEFKPELVMVAAGFDGHWHDSMSSLNLTVEGFASMTDQVLNLADKFCQGRAIFSLEGGYDLKALSYSVAQVVANLAGVDKVLSDPYGAPLSFQTVSKKEVIERVKGIIIDYWKI